MKIFPKFEINLDKFIVFCLNFKKKCKLYIEWSHIENY